MTQVAMHPIISVSSDEVEDDVAFKVLNQDNLPISIVGETILKPFGREQQKLKPNVIVHPTRRVVTNLEENKQKPFAKSNGHISNAEKNLKKNFSNSHGNLNNNTSSTKLKFDDLKNQFTKTLDAKLRRLQKEEKQSKKPPVDTTSSRKPFVTTVKKGLFLEPPSEIATLIGLKPEEPVKKEYKEEKRLYAYASQPRVLNRTHLKGHQNRCEAAAKAAAKLIGTVVGIKNEEKENTIKKQDDAPVPYANLMFEKRIFRGSNFAPPTCGQGDGESAAARAAEAKRRAMARRKAKNQQIRATQLRLGSPPAIPGRKHEKVQTELYLEEIYVNPPVIDMCTQTDLFVERPVSPFYVPAKIGADVATQIYPGELFDFDAEVQPILEVLVGKTIEQALIEVLEEEELAAIREQQRRFLEIRAAETAEALRLEEREKRLVKEKERRISELEEGIKTQKEMEERIAAAVLMQGYMANLLPSVLEGLESEGFLVDSIKKDVDESFMPWLMKEVTQELQEMVSSRDVLTDIVREILENRAEIYAALNKEPIPEQEAEEGPTIDDLILQDHLKLQQEIAKKSKEEDLKFEL
ncbi:radial spoke head protein 3 homolog B isoform X2 [Anoplophora glabripennis]|uniref:radial spoke head protein 3 homolog B isoform X2 n=1 Tax=Anoplophora glabripennis TaxID=217634 RepID=UPI000874FA09|nr:radial spoke head protein 3 homolog B isoform X2 [Anoplophora glabripennis]